MSEKARPSYVAVARSLIKDPRFRRPANRPLTELEATIWLICEAAWKPRALQTRFGPIHNDRSQFSTTERALAKEWNWSKSKVHRFVQELVADGMVKIELARPGPKTMARDGAERGYPRSLITLCNYDKFQAVIRGSSKSAKHGSNHEADQKQSEIPGLIYAIASEPTKPINHQESKNLLGEGFIGKNRPRHGKVWKGLVFCHHGTDDWRAFARDFEQARGTPIFPRRYLDGFGNWFVASGEANREPWQATA